MDNLSQEISEDYDTDCGDHEFRSAFGDDIDRLNSDVVEGDEISLELDALLEASAAIESFGATRSSISAMEKSGLLAGTAIGAIGVESFSAEGSVEETAMALESLLDKIKEKSTQWSAKIVKFVGEMSGRVVSVISTMWEKIAASSKALTTKAWDQAKATGQMIKAHPFKTIALVVAAAAAVAGIAAYVASGMPGDYANESALQSFIIKVEDMIKKINFPFGKITTSITNNGTKLVIQIEKSANVIKEATAASLGWSQTAIRSISGNLSGVFGKIKVATSSVSDKVVKAATFLNKSADEVLNKTEAKVKEKTKSGLAGWASKKIVEKMYTTALWALVGVLYNLMKTVVLDAFKSVRASFNGLKPVVNEATA